VIQFISARLRTAKFASNQSSNMTQPLLSEPVCERPALLTSIAVLALAYALLLCVCGALSLAGRMSMRLGAQLLGSGLEVMGPIPYFLYAIALALCAWGLLRRHNWARRLTIIVAATGVILLVPHISSAVMDERWLAMSVDGFQILIRVSIASYLFRESEWFNVSRVSEN
jgi:hypothetical protein